MAMNVLVSKGYAHVQSFLANAKQSADGDLRFSRCLHLAIESALARI